MGQEVRFSGAARNDPPAADAGVGRFLGLGTAITLLLMIFQDHGQNRNQNNDAQDQREVVVNEGDIAQQRTDNNEAGAPP